MFLYYFKLWEQNDLFYKVSGITRRIKRNIIVNILIFYAFITKFSDRKKSFKAIFNVLRLFYFLLPKCEAGDWGVKLHQL